MQPRYSGRWWIDQEGTEWSAFDLWKGAVLHSLERIVWNDEQGIRVYRTADDELRHLIRIPPPDVDEAEKAAFFEEWNESGRPPTR